MKSIVWATHLDVLPLDRTVERRSDFLVVRSPSNPAHYWGNLLLFDRAPVEDDALRWEASFDDAFGDDPRIRHRTFAWDQTDGAFGALREEFVSRGYDIDESIGLVAEAHEVVAHPRENREVAVRTVDPAIGADESLWEAVVELAVAGRDDEFEEESYHAFSRARLEDQRALFRAGRGSWYLAIDPATGDVVGSCGVVVTADRGRFQSVDTALAHRRRGISSRLLVEAARHAAENYGAERFVIVGDAEYFAVGLYESLGFARTEHVVGVCLPPRTA